MNKLSIQDFRDSQVYNIIDEQDNLIVFEVPYYTLQAQDLEFSKPIPNDEKLVVGTLTLSVTVRDGYMHFVFNNLEIFIPQFKTHGQFKEKVTAETEYKLVVDQIRKSVERRLAQNQESGLVASRADSAITEAIYGLINNEIEVRLREAARIFGNNNRDLFKNGSITAAFAMIATQLFEEENGRRESK
jgi:hypothetical protein